MPVSITLSALLQLTHASSGYRSAIESGLLFGQVDASTDTVRILGCLPTPLEGEDGVSRRVRHWCATKPHTRAVGFFAFEPAFQTHFVSRDWSVCLQIDPLLFQRPKPFTVNASKRSRPEVDADEPLRSRDTLLEVCDAISSRNEDSLEARLANYVKVLSLPSLLKNPSALIVERDEAATLVLSSLYALTTTRDITACPVLRPIASAVVPPALLRLLVAIHERDREACVARILKEPKGTALEQQVIANEQLRREAHTGLELALVMRDFQQLIASQQQTGKRSSPAL